MSDPPTPNVSSALAPLVAQVTGMTVEVPMDQVLAVRDKVRVLAELLRQLRQWVDERTIEWINANGPIRCGDKELRVGTDKTINVKGLDPKAKAVTRGKLLNRAMELAGGDMEALAERFLASGAFKHGALRKELEPSEFESFFEEVTKEVVEEGSGKRRPAKKLLEIDPRFMRGNTDHVEPASDQPE
jgi:hypothetical protein